MRRTLLAGFGPTWTLAALAVLVVGSGCSGTGSRKAHSASQNPAASFLSGGGTNSKLNDAQAADVAIAEGRLAESRRDLPGAIEKYMEAMHLDGTRPDAPLRLAICFDSIGQFSESQPLYQKALELDPGNPQVYCAVGYSRYLQGDMTAAEQNLRQALALRPDYPQAHNNLGALLARTGRIPEALREFHYGGCTEPESHSNVALACMLEHRFDKARQHYQLALEVDGTYATAIHGLKKLEQVDQHLARMDRVNQGTLVAAAPAPAAATSVPAHQVSGSKQPQPPKPQPQPQPKVQVLADPPEPAPVVRRVPAVTPQPESRQVIQASNSVVSAIEEEAQEIEEFELHFAPGALQVDRP